jgi:formylglycine-generating enzyme
MQQGMSPVSSTYMHALPAFMFANRQLALAGLLVLAAACTPSAEAAPGVPVETRGMIALASTPATEVRGPDLFLQAGKRFDAPRFTWQALGGKHWQVVAEGFEPTAVTDAQAGNRGSCPAGMVHVAGQMKLEPATGASLERLQLDTCTDWLNKDFPARCKTFDRQAWRERTAALPTQSMDFCIDRFEYPNVKGQYPAAFVDAKEAAGLCAEQGKRLCDEDEWTFACEGEEAVPYSQDNAYTRDSGSCIADVEWTAPNEAAMLERGGGGAAMEMDRLWHGKRSGEQSRCKSAFGVHDMVGNVDEWTTAVAGREGSAVVLKGGYWGPVRARCRPSTRSHDANHKYFQQGFRCCSGAAKS